MAAIETLRQNVAALNVTSPVGAEIMREVQGQYRGEGVKAASTANNLQDAAEEIGMAVAHRADRRTLRQREVRQGQGASFESLSRIADYQDKLPDMPKGADLKNLVDLLSALQEQLLEGGGKGGGPTKDDILAALAQLDADPTHQYAALDIAREYFASAGVSDEFQMLLDAAFEEYTKGDLGRDVRAGFASAQAASRAAATLESDPATVRDVYRQMLPETQNAGVLFEQFRSFDPLRNFDETIDLFMEVASGDLRSTGPSTDPILLHKLVTELSQLKKMRSVVDMAGDLTRQTDRLLQPGERPEGDAVDVAGRMLTFASRPAAGSQDAEALLQRYDTCSTATQLAFANGLRAMHGELPDEIMPTPQARLQQNTAIMLLLDRLVEREEAEYSAPPPPAPAASPGARLLDPRA